MKHGGEPNGHMSISHNHVFGLYVTACEKACIVHLRREIKSALSVNYRAHGNCVLVLLVWRKEERELMQHVNMKITGTILGSR